MRDYFLSASPVILSDCMVHWPARVKWNDINYLKKVAGSRTVPVEVMKFILQEMLAYIDAHLLKRTNNRATKFRRGKEKYEAVKMRL